MYLFIYIYKYCPRVIGAKWGFRRCLVDISKKNSEFIYEEAEINLPFLSLNENQ